MCGLVAGIVADILSFLVDGMLLAPRWADGMTRLGHGAFSPNEWIWFNVIGTCRRDRADLDLCGHPASLWRRSPDRNLRRDCLLVCRILLPKPHLHVGWRSVFPSPDGDDTAGNLIETLAALLPVLPFTRNRRTCAIPKHAHFQRIAQARQQGGLRGPISCRRN